MLGILHQIPFEWTSHCSLQRLIHSAFYLAWAGGESQIGISANENNSKGPTLVFWARSHIREQPQLASSRASVCQHV